MLTKWNKNDISPITVLISLEENLALYFKELYTDKNSAIYYANKYFNDFRGVTLPVLEYKGKLMLIESHILKNFENIKYLDIISVKIHDEKLYLMLREGTIYKSVSKELVVDLNLYERYRWYRTKPEMIYKHL